MSLLEVRDLVTGYGETEIIHGVSLEVEAGEIVSIIGPNGAGKSTLLKAVFGLNDRWDGVVQFDGEEIDETEPNALAARGLCYVPQTANVFPNLTVVENLRMGAYVLDDVPSDVLSDIFDRFPILEERKNQRAGSMSGGQQQMLAFGRALMVDPDLLLVDEPSAGLAPDFVDQIFDKLLQINESGTAIVMVEQNATKALENSDRGYVLEMGENRYQGTGSELLNDDDVIDLYLGGTQRV